MRSCALCVAVSENEKSSKSPPVCTVQTVRGHPCPPASRPRCLCMDRVFATRPEQTSSHCQPGQDNAWATLTLFPRVLIQNLNNNVSLARGHRPTLLTPPGTTRICFQGLNIVVQRERDRCFASARVISCLRQSASQRRVRTFRISAK